jgi:hypothetical protein
MTSDDARDGTGRSDHPQDVPALRLELAARGYTPVPCAGKRPVLKTWQRLENVSREQVNMWTVTWPDAVNTGALTARMPTLDIDILDPAAVDAIVELVRDKYLERGYVPARAGKAPKAALIFRTDEPFKKILIPLIAPFGSAEALEILCDGQQVVVDGIHPDTGHAYSWQGGSPLEIPREELAYISAADAQQLIDDVVELLVRDFGYSRPTKGKGNGSAKAEADSGGSDWGDLYSNISNGRALHDSLRDLAAKLVKSGTSAGAAVNQLRALLEASNAPRDDRFEERMGEIPRLVDSAIAKYARKDNSAPSPQPSPNATELMTMMFKPIKYVVPGVIVEGLTLLCGKPKIGKSWLLLHAAVAVARGGYTLGDIECTQGDVLYLALEDNLRRLQFDAAVRLLAPSLADYLRARGDQQ